MDSPVPLPVYLALGSNLGDRPINLTAARQALPPAVKIRRTSMIYETAPWGFLDQPKFLNQVLEIDTCLSPLSLLAYLKRIETDLGRTPTFHFGPRLIDIDILLYGDQVIELADLVVPHPQMHERAFVLIPLAELAPNACHPTLGQTIGQLLTQVDTSGVEVYRG